MPSRYLSATEFLFNQDQTEDIVRAAAHHRTDYDSSVIWFSSDTYRGFYCSIATPLRRTSNVGLGALDRLPLDVWQAIIANLDIDSVFKFRRINLRSRQMMDSLHQYRMIVLHGMNLLYALFRTELALIISLSEIYTALCTKACAVCGQFAGFISLLTWERCCFKCLQEAPECQVMTQHAVQKKLNMAKGEVKCFRSFRTLPGKYMLEGFLYAGRCAIVSQHQAGIFTDRFALLWRQGYRSTRLRAFKFMATCALPYWDRQTGQIDPGLSCTGCTLSLSPHINAACNEKWAREARDKVYGQDEFLDHFRWCKNAQRLWMSSSEYNN